MAENPFPLFDSIASQAAAEAGIAKAAKARPELLEYISRRRSRAGIMTKDEMLARRAMLRSEFDHLLWRKRRMDERLDALAGEIEQLSIEAAVDAVIEESAAAINAVPNRAVFMEMV